MEKQLRVALFMRVSTKKQTNGGKKATRNGKEARPSAIKEDDSIPLQRKLLTDYVEGKKEDGWVLADTEYIEAGISGFHTHSSKRKELQRAFEDGKMGKYDILLLYKLDRFGRRSSESLDLALKFLRYVRIWVVDKDSEFTNSNDGDEIKNFIEFWAAKRASMDTKKRVTDAMNQIHKENYFTGGEPAYGYKIHPTKTGVLEIVPEEVDIVREIYHRYVVSGWGMIKIAKYLNEKGIVTRRGKQWRNDGISVILKNTIYKGYLSYGKTKTVSTEFGTYQKRQKEFQVSDKYIPEYQIINTELWQQAQEKREKRRDAYFSPTEDKRSHSGRGKALLTGILYCECDGKMVRDSKKYRYKGKETKVIKYRCINSRKGGLCNAKQKSYKAIDIENGVLELVEKEIKCLIQSNTILEIQKEVNKQMDMTQTALKQAKEEVERTQKTINRLDDILLKLLMGEEENYSEDQVKRLYEKSKQELEEKKAYYDELVSLQSVSAINEVDAEKLQESILEWRTIFNIASPEEKRAFIQSVVESIHMDGKDVRIKFRFDVTRFFGFVSATREAFSASNYDDRGTDSVSKTHKIFTLQMDERRITKTFPEPITRKIHFKI